MSRNQLTRIRIAIPFKSAGNSIIQKEVSFDVFADGTDYVLVPDLQPSDLRIANLPSELVFTVENEKPVSRRGPQDGNFHVIQDAFQKMKQLNVVQD